MSGARAIAGEPQSTPTRISCVPPGVPVAGSGREEVDGEAVSLARLVLFPPNAAPRRRVLFAWTEPEPGKAEFCERVARAVTKICSGSVALVESAPPSQRNETSIHEVSPASAPSAAQGEEHIWRVSPETLSSEFTRAAIPFADFPFDCVIFGASVQESWAPVLAGCCDAAVLVVTANRTRRQAALRAREILAGWNVPLLGAVLNDRAFPVPESIYRRL